MKKSAPNQLSVIISALGGPSIQAEDIEWAIDLPAGKRLVDWIAAQLLDYETDDGRETHQAALGNIALEAEEVDMCVFRPWEYNNIPFDSCQV